LGGDGNARLHQEDQVLVRTRRLEPVREAVEFDEVDVSAA